MAHSAFNYSSGGMPYGALNFSFGDKQERDNDGGSSLEPMNIEEAGKPVATDDDESSIIPQADQTKAPISFSGGSIAHSAFNCSSADIPDSIRKTDLPAVPVQGKQRIKASAHPAGTSGVADSNIPSFLSMPEPDHKRSTPVDTTKNHMNQQIQLLHGFSTLAHGVQDDTFPTSNANSVPKKVESFSELIDVEKDYNKDYDMDYGMLIEYPLRHSPECVLLTPVRGANTHPDYLWKEQ